MKEVLLTNKEKTDLENKLQNYKSHRNKQLKEFLIIIVIGTIIGGFSAYLNNDNVKLLSGLLGIMIVLLIPLTIAFLTSKKGINNLMSDLKIGKKTEGKATIKSINIFNRKISLSNGIKVFEPNEYYETFKKGDLIKYKISPSNEFIFYCKKE
ncbi:hypothetical protein [Olleya namhaensis]|uniref:Uncharacterized protein n=1 Tax=Olleya namhaensis TaxID=1144750 RepID=A0A1I3SL64_9FLAO|nr:hypothetical protein [Olleya namhaensis]SFJ59465.1 hypothetical protein SAMN05443431_1111 [Olleya namhaensis]